MRVSVELEGLPPSPNRTRRDAHWSARAALAKRWRSQAFYSVQAFGPFTPMTRARLSVRFYLPDKRRRDPGNLVGSEGLKAAIDGLVDAGVMADDSTDVIVEYGPFLFEYRRNKPGVLITVEGA